MNSPSFHDETSLAETTEKLAKKAMQFQIIPSFRINFFPDSYQFIIPGQGSEPLTPEQAYMRLKQLLETAGQPVNP